MTTLITKQGNQSLSFGDNSFFSDFVAVRVTSVILDVPSGSNVPSGSVSDGVYTIDEIGAITYSFLDRRQTSTHIAYPLNSNIQNLPLVGEIVLKLKSAAKIDIKGTDAKEYYIAPISLWNHPTDGKAPTTNTTIEEAIRQDPHPFPDIRNVNPLQPFPGDTLIQGRLGQSIRLGGAKYTPIKQPFTNNILTDDSNNGRPFTILSNGQKNVNNGSEAIVEDINEDDSSIYLLSNHTVPISQSLEKYDSIKNKPILAKDYQGSQVIINGGRLFFNSKDPNGGIGLSTSGMYNVTAQTIGLDAVSEIGLDARKIYLGKGCYVRSAPVPRGDFVYRSFELIKEMLTQIQGAMRTATVDVGGGKVLSLNIEAKTIEDELRKLNELIERINSKVVFVESDPNYEVNEIPRSTVNR